MRFKLIFTRTGRSRMLPMDYQYYLSAWIYKVLKQADAQYATFLHNNGYGRPGDNKLYKLFCYSRLNFGKPVLWKDKRLFEVKNREAELHISFDVDDAAMNFIKGLFSSQSVYLGDQFNGIDFTVSSVEGLGDPDFKTEMRYRLRSPWVVSINEDKSIHPQYLYPDHKDFIAYAVKHIKEKYYNTRMKECGEIAIEDLSEYKKSGFLIKPGTKEETRVIGSLFDFTLKASPEVHKMIWNAGISEKSSNGFGWVELS
jgi:CRISPR-associated endoribonuclease Cas6